VEDGSTRFDFCAFHIQVQSSAAEATYTPYFFLRRLFWEFLLTGRRVTNRSIIYLCALVSSSNAQTMDYGHEDESKFYVFLVMKISKLQFGIMLNVESKEKIVITFLRKKEWKMENKRNANKDRK
jgi:hypothetical protein